MLRGDEKDPIESDFERSRGIKIICYGFWEAMKNITENID